MTAPHELTCLGRAIPKGHRPRSGHHAFCCQRGCRPGFGVGRTLQGGTVTCAIRSAPAPRHSRIYHGWPPARTQPAPVQRRIDPNAVSILNLFPAPNSGLTDLQRQPRPFRASQPVRHPRGREPQRQGSDLRPLQLSPTIPSSFRASSAALRTAVRFNQGFRPPSRTRWWRATRTYSPPTPSTRCAPASLICTPPASAQKATVAGIPEQIRHSRESRSIPQGQENGGLPAFGIGNLAQLGKQRLPAIRRSQPDAPGHGRLHQDLWQAQLQDGHRVPEREVLDTAAGLVARPVQLRRRLHRYPQPGPDHRRHSPDCSASATAAPARSAAYPNPNGIQLFRRLGQTSTPRTSTRPTIRRCISPPTSRMTGRSTPKLTLNLGVRWDYFGPINETNGGQANFVPTALPGTQPRCSDIPSSGHRNAKDFIDGHPSYTAAMAHRSPCLDGNLQRYRLYGFVDLAARTASPCCRPTAGAQGCCRPRRATSLPASALRTGQSQAGGSRRIRALLQLL